MQCSYSFPALVQVPLGATGLAFKASPTASLSIQPQSDDSTLELTSSQSVYAAVYYNGEVTSSKNVSNNATTTSNLSGGHAQFDIGIKAAIGLPEWGGTEIGPEASLTTGTSFTLGPPDPADDPFYRTLAGPRCLDAKQTLFVSFGAGLLVPFLPDVNLTIARVDTDPVVWYRGPCVGYTGTITTKWKGAYPQGAAGCTAQACPSRDWDHTIVQTLIPGLASFDPQYGYVQQPYTWSWTGKEIVEDDVPMTYDGQVTTPCKWTDTSNGSGTAGWITEGQERPSLWQGWHPEGGTYAAHGVWGGSGTTSRAVEGDPDWCGTAADWPAMPLTLDANQPEGTVGFTSIDKPAITGTLTYEPPYHPDWGWTITFNLTRVEYNRIG